MIFTNDDGAVERHVLPQADIREHDEARTCWCQPFDDDGVWVHNSLDRREEYETGRRRAS